MTYRWTTKDLDDLEAFYWEEVAPVMREEDLDPKRERPPYAWMTERGFSGFIKALQRDHDLTSTEFYDRLNIGTEGEDDYWKLGHGSTRSILDKYVNELLDRRGHPETTVMPIRSRLKKYAQLYTDVNETPDLLAPLLEESERPAEIDRALAVFDVLDEVLSTPASKFKYLEDTRRFYDYLLDAGRAAYNPLDRMERRFGWDRPEWDNPALDRVDVRTLYQAAEGLEECLLVVGLAGWGLRPSELCALRAEQVVLGHENDEYPYLAFGEGERKNGPGTVALLVGVDELAARIDALAEDPGWSGYLFPSTAAANDHIVTDTMRNRFATLAERADVTITDRTPTPKMGRRFWYAIYGDAVRQIAERYMPIAEDQGSSDPGVVLDNYLSEAERRKHRREAMHDELAGLLNDESTSAL
jgi:integrase